MWMILMTSNSLHLDHKAYASSAITSDGR